MKDLKIQIIYLLHITKHFQLQNGNKFSMLIASLSEDNSPAKYSKLKGISLFQSYHYLFQRKFIRLILRPKISLSQTKNRLNIVTN